MASGSPRTGAMLQESDELLQHQQDDNFSDQDVDLDAPTQMIEAGSNIERQVGIFSTGMKKGSLIFKTTTQLLCKFFGNISH